MCSYLSFLRQFSPPSHFKCSPSSRRRGKKIPHLIPNNNTKKWTDRPRNVHDWLERKLLSSPPSTMKIGLSRPTALLRSISSHFFLSSSLPDLSGVGGGERGWWWLYEAEGCVAPSSLSPIPWLLWFFSVKEGNWNEFSYLYLVSTVGGSDNTWTEKNSNELQRLNLRNLENIQSSVFLVALGRNVASFSIIFGREPESVTLRMPARPRHCLRPNHWCSMPHYKFIWAFVVSCFVLFQPFSFSPPSAPEIDGYFCAFFTLAKRRREAVVAFAVLQ